MLSSKDKIESRDVFAREASIVNQIHQKTFFISDICKFDIMKSELFYFNRNINNTSLFSSATWCRSCEY
jgi:hypothetical protein